MCKCRARCFSHCRPRGCPWQWDPLRRDAATLLSCSQFWPCCHVSTCCCGKVNDNALASQVVCVGVAGQPVLGVWLTGLLPPSCPIRPICGRQAADPKLGSQRTVLMLKRRPRGWRLLATILSHITPFYLQHESLWVWTMTEWKGVL